MSTETTPRDIRNAVKERYRQAAEGTGSDFPYPTGREGARRLGYAPELIASAPAGLLELFCGVGCPFALGEPAPGERILDVGCGGGFDLFCAARMSGPRGRACGIDLTFGMVARAQEQLERAEVDNARVQAGKAEALPFADARFDLVISNGVLNMSPEKDRAFAEIFRVLRPGGRLQFADLVLERELPPEAKGADAWSE